MTVRRLLPPGAAQADDGTGALERVGHGDEVVLAAGAADDAAVLELVGGDGAQQSRHHGGVDEARIAALGALAASSPPSVLVKEMPVIAIRSSVSAGISRN